MRRSPEQPPSQQEEVEMATSQESKEGLRQAIQILSEANEQAIRLEDEAKNLTRQERFLESLERSMNRARILVDLPDRLQEVLGGVDRETRQEVLSKVSIFAGEARRAIEEGEKAKAIAETEAGEREKREAWGMASFVLDTLLHPRGRTVDENNELEDLIEFLEAKVQ